MTRRNYLFTYTRISERHPTTRARTGLEYVGPIRGVRHTRRYSLFIPYAYRRDSTPHAHAHLEYVGLVGLLGVEPRVQAKLPPHGCETRLQGLYVQERDRAISTKWLSHTREVPPPRPYSPFPPRQTGILRVGQYESPVAPMMWHLGAADRNVCAGHPYLHACVEGEPHRARHKSHPRACTQQAQSPPGKWWEREYP